MEQKESKNKKNILNSIGKSSSNIAKCVVLIGIIGLPLVFPGETTKVAKNSTLSGIAQEYGTTWPRLEKRNKLKDPNYIQAGQELIIYNKGPVGLYQTAEDILDKYWF